MKNCALCIIVMIGSGLDAWPALGARPVCHAAEKVNLPTQMRMGVRYGRSLRYTDDLGIGDSTATRVPARPPCGCGVTEEELAICELCNLASVAAGVLYAPGYLASTSWFVAEASYVSLYTVSSALGMHYFLQNYRQTQGTLTGGIVGALLGSAAFCACFHIIFLSSESPEGFSVAHPLIVIPLLTLPVAGTYVGYHSASRKGGVR